MWNRNKQTICAVSTPDGVGGIAVIRVSGKEALTTCKKISKTLRRKDLVESHRVYFSDVIDLEGAKIDEAVFTFFAEGKSFTGEEVVEISCHGSRLITTQILNLLVRLGCRLAEKGEFTYRAFMSGNLDLVQAESVLALIESQNEASAKVALRQLSGKTSKEIEGLISNLTWCLAHIEASIDFAEQGIEVVDQSVLTSKLNSIADSLKKLVGSYQAGKLIKDGVRVALVGEPNVGKSSLLNLLLQDDKAIVTPIAGTTRDVVTDSINYRGIKYNISDTAGLRETTDHVEIIGIDRSKKEAEKADVLCFVFDCTDQAWERALFLSKQMKHKKMIFLLNKSDKIEPEHREKLLQGFGERKNVIFTSAIEEESREGIFGQLREVVGNPDYLNEAIISSARQHESLLYSYEMIVASIGDLQQKTGAEFVAMHLKESLVALQKIIGMVYDDQIMDRVFKEFCLGK